MQLFLDGHRRGVVTLQTAIVFMLALWVAPKTCAGRTTQGEVALKSLRGRGGPMIDTLLFRSSSLHAERLLDVLLVAATALLSCFARVKGLGGDGVLSVTLCGMPGGVALDHGLTLIVGAFARGMSCAMLDGYLSIEQDGFNGYVMGSFSGMFGRHHHVTLRYHEPSSRISAVLDNMLGSARRTLDGC